MLPTPSLADRVDGVVPEPSPPAGGGRRWRAQVSSGGKRWTEELDKKLEQMRRDEKTVHEIAEEMGRTCNAVKKRANELDKLYKPDGRRRSSSPPPKRNSFRWTEEDFGVLRDMHARGYDTADIAAALKRTAFAVKKKMKRDEREAYSDMVGTDLVLHDPNTLLLTQDCRLDELYRRGGSDTSIDNTRSDGESDIEWELFKDCDGKVEGGTHLQCYADTGTGFFDEYDSLVDGDDNYDKPDFTTSFP